MNIFEYKQQYKNFPKKEMTRCFNEFPIQDRKDFLDLLSKKDRKKFIKEIREQAVKDFWTHEQALIKEGKCTRDWTPEQVEDVLHISEK